MQFLLLTDAQKSTMRDQLAQGDYFDGVGAKIVGLLLDPEVSGYTKGALALEHNNLIPYDKDNAHILPWYRASHCELIEFEKISFVMTKMNLKSFESHIEEFTQGTKTLHEFKQAAEAVGACIIRFNL